MFLMFLMRALRIFLTILFFVGVGRSEGFAQADSLSIQFQNIFQIFENEIEPYLSNLLKISLRQRWRVMQIIMSWFKHDCSYLNKSLQG
jgi:hypothetical protein